MRFVLNMFNFSQEIQYNYTEKRLVAKIERKKKQMETTKKNSFANKIIEIIKILWK